MREVWEEIDLEQRCHNHSKCDSNAISNSYPVCNCYSDSIGFRIHHSNADSNTYANTDSNADTNADADSDQSWLHH